MGVKKDILFKRIGFKIPEGYFESINNDFFKIEKICLLYTSPSPRDS